VVLADGRILSSLNKMLKNNAGYDLKQLFIGSEGTLGVITRAVLRLFPQPRTTGVAMCAAESYESVLRVLDLARSRLGGNLTAFEVMWKEFYTVVTSQRSRPGPLAEGHEFYLLIEASGTDEQTDTQRFEALFEQAFGEGVLVDAAIAKSGAEVEAMWSIRDASGELERLFGRAVNFDVSIPVAKIAEFVADCLRRLQTQIADSRVLVFGHIADSNIHLACRDSQIVPPKEAIERIVYGCVGDWQGSISAEHGIGISRRRYLAQSRTADELIVMRVIKDALDPNHILNPGKVLPGIHG
jgi:FAD/FMN-containing dehydrogenase